jgi:ribosome-interacting GTPase 1
VKIRVKASAWNRQLLEALVARRIVRDNRGQGIRESFDENSRFAAPMPANLTPQYLKAEEAYRRASTPDEELQCLQEMLRELPKHKGTDKLQAELKQKISKAKKEADSVGKAGKKGYGIRIPRQGAGRAVLLGGPNAGKSQLLRALTRATPDVAEYPFTTREPLPGMMPWEDVMVQLIDTPPITADILEPYHQGLIRGADLTILLVDLASDDGIEQVQDVISRLNETKTRLGRESYLDENDIGLSYTQTFLVPNKIDAEEATTRLELLHEIRNDDFREYVISALHGAGLETLRDAIYQALDVVRVYTKLPSKKEPDYDRPYTVRRGGTLADVAAMIHKDLAAQLKFARVWGSQVHDATSVKGDYVLHDRDVIELHA